eukprot:TRINITY_DN14730_c0_g1_i1.p1 TRINITY_DN14730_c0_g1~~TRINITY_DN14730_c0_g1_i1.p1  ORF type:complete len:788 (+),score=217.56 TRINITY_DN14730_c0_g1_i1:37-2364(+)
MDENKRQAALAKLIRTFGNGLEKDVLESVLEITNGDADEAIAFLQASNEGNEYIDDPARNQTEAIPDGFFNPPPNFDGPLPNPEQDEAQNLRDFFIEDRHLFAEHLVKITDQPHLYATVLLLLLHQQVDINTTTKSRALAVAWIKSRSLADRLLKFTEDFQLPEVLKAVKLLDGPRQLRALKKKLERFETGGQKAKPATLGLLRGRIHDLELSLELPVTSLQPRPSRARRGNTDTSQNEGGWGLIPPPPSPPSTPSSSSTSTLETPPREFKFSLSGNILKRVRAWIKTIPPHKLEFFALALPRKPWRELSDLIHPRPADFAVEWFLRFVHSDESQEAPSQAPLGSVVHRVSSLRSPDDAEAAILRENLSLPYSFLRRQLPGASLSPAARARIATYEKLAVVLWYYEELALAEPDAANAQEQVDRIVQVRLNNGEVPDETEMGYGKLMERLLTLKNNQCGFWRLLAEVAQKRLRSQRLPLEQPVVVLGDKSYSMDVAIRTSSILASLFTALAQADLKFFNVETSRPPNGPPRTVEEVLEVAANTRADGLTAPACALNEDHRAGKSVRWYVLVSDEGENLPSDGTFFAQAFYSYVKQVSPRARIVLVSFLDNPRVKGRMHRALEQMGAKPVLLRLDAKRPDLTKASSLVGLLACQTASFSAKAFEIADTVREVGLSSVPDDSFKLSDVELDLVVQEPTDPVVQEPTEPDVAEPTEPVVQEPSAAAEQRICSVCLSAPVTTVLLDCGHMSFCGDCAAPLKNCPLCRAPVVRCMRVFMS